MKKWLISSDPKKCDFDYYYPLGYVDWIQHGNYEIGDIVYIYCKPPNKKIMYKTVVEEESLYSDEYSGEKNLILRFIEFVDNDDLSLENLRIHGLKNPPMKKMEVKGDLEKYLDKYFTKIPDKTNIWLIKDNLNLDKLNYFREHSLLSVGEVGSDLKGKNKKEIGILYKKTYSDSSNPATATKVALLNKFVNEIEIGDYIIFLNDSNNEIYFGKCTSDYYFDDNEGIQFRNCRKVEWLCNIKENEISDKAKKLLNVPLVNILGLTSEVKKEFFDIYNSKFFTSDEPRNLIYFGAPGTGKSFCLEKMKEKFLKHYENNYERVTFHPDYTYANFVGTYKPIVKEDKISYGYVPGSFLRILVKALRNPSEPFVLIIEEINRANVAAVFGDVFQLLDRDEDYCSKFPINVSEDMKKYLENELKCRRIALGDLGKSFDTIRIPSNMFIWATMNSADQGVFPMDTAFKRRWDFKYFNIHSKESKVDQLKVNLNGKEFSWNQIRNAINKELITYGINEDKLMGPFFAFTNYIKEDLPEEEVVKIDSKEFKDIFMNKIIMYLFEDVARAKRDVLFKGALERQKNDKNITYYQICDDFKENELEIFSKKIRNELGIGE